MRRVFGCLLFATLLFTAIYFAGWWFQSPRLDISTPAKQGAWFVKRVYLAEYDTVLNHDNSFLYASGTNIVVEFDNPPYGVAAPQDIRVITSDGQSMRTQTLLARDTFGEDSLWHGAWQWIASRIGISSQDDLVWRVYIPISYLPSVRYLDVYADSPDVANSRWRLVNLPRPAHVVTRSAKSENCYRVLGFEVCASAKRSAADVDSVIDVIFDIRLTPVASCDSKLYMLISGVHPEWLKDGCLTADHPPRMVADHSGRYTMSFRIPFARHQRYLRLDCTATLVRYRNEQRQVSLPIYKIKADGGHHRFVLAAPRRKVIDLIGGSVHVPSVREYPELVSLSLTDLPPRDRVILFYWRQIDWSVADEIELSHLNIEDCSVTSSPGVPFPYQLSKLGFLPARKEGFDLLSIKLPRGIKNLRQIPINFKGRGIVWHSGKHQFTLTTQVEEE